jgi:hypothetical protein
MTTLYQGPAVLTLPENVTVDVDVDIWQEQEGPLVQWGGTATTDSDHQLWQEEREEQRMIMLRLGDEIGGYQVGEGMIISPAGDGSENSVELRGSGDFAPYEAP